MFTVILEGVRNTDDLAVEILASLAVLGSIDLIGKTKLWPVLGRLFFIMFMFSPLHLLIEQNVNTVNSGVAISDRKWSP